MRIAVTGHKGRLGSQLCKLGCIPFDCDVLNYQHIQQEIVKTLPDIIIHCASVTDVDGAEFELKFLTREVNERGTFNLRRFFDGRIIYISTDYVFDGKKGPYSEKDIPNPVNHYGLTKYLGEKVLELSPFNNYESTIVRTTNLYGGNKEDFAFRILANLMLGNKFTVTNKVYGNATYVPHLAKALLELCRLPNLPKVINIAGSDILSRYEFAVMIANVFEYDTTLITPTNEVPGEAKRPVKGGLKLTLAKSLGLSIYSALEGLQELKQRTLK